MRFLLKPLLALLVLAGTGLPAMGQDRLPEEFFGKFRGELTGSDGKSSGQFNLVISKSRGGFTVQWPTRIEAQFEAAGRPGVFRHADGANPLEGEPVYWARTDKGALIVYLAQIDSHGGYQISNYRYALAGDGMDVEFTRIVTGADPVVSKGRLARHGG